MAYQLNISIDQGSDFSQALSITNANGDPFDFSSYAGAGKIRKHYEAANSVTLTVEGDSDGVLTISLDHETTTNMEPGRYVYDVEMTAANVVTRVVEGLCTIRPHVTY